MPSKEVGERAIHLTEANLQRCAQVAGNQLKASSSGREVIGVLLAWLPPPIRVGTVAQYVPATVDDHYQGAIIPRCGEGEGAVGLVVSDGDQTWVTGEFVPNQRITLSLATGTDGDDVDVLQVQLIRAQHSVDRSRKTGSVLDAHDTFLCQRADDLAIDQDCASPMAELLPESRLALGQPEDLHPHLHGRLGQNACRVRAWPATTRTNRTVAMLRTMSGSLCARSGLKMNASATIAARTRKNA